MSSKLREALSEIIDLINEWRNDGVMETISQPNRGARWIAETTEAKDPPHGAVRNG